MLNKHSDQDSTMVSPISPHSQAGPISDPQKSLYSVSPVSPMSDICFKVAEETKTSMDSGSRDCSGPSDEVEPNAGTRSLTSPKKSVCPILNGGQDNQYLRESGGFDYPMREAGSSSTFEMDKESYELQPLTRPQDLKRSLAHSIRKSRDQYRISKRLPRIKTRLPRF
ncbi:hypothetical protein TWF481_010386 [Arthrobotrys musiformis]|uniref:Uncharacterized protein n=1 Tax=Arthrobotrys musiformis TaxID=47236 RepID=A0AAV9W0T3_9PEZI